MVEGVAMGLWARLSITAVVSLVVGAGLWVVLDARGVDPGLAIGGAGGLVTVMVTLGAVWVSRARESTASAAETGALVSGSPSGQAVGQALAPVFGPGSDFTNVLFTFHSASGSGPPASERPVAPEMGGRRVVVGEIPQEPPAFQHRAELLEALTRPEAEDRVRVVFAVTGLRGIGKSQLAAACARQRLTQGWRLVAWLDASGREQLLAGYAQLAAELGLAGDSPDSADAAARVRHWLETGGEQCLIVLDNAGNADLLRPLLPAAGHAQVIVTSSRIPLAALGTPIPVDVFTEPETVSFLIERTGLSDEDGALEVARELGCLPLALAQAAAVIAGQHLSYSSYLQRLAAVTVAHYLSRPEEDPYPHGTAQTITLALNAAQAADSSGLGRHLLEVIAVLSSTGTSRSLLAEAVNRGTSEMDSALQRLGAWSLVTWSMDGTSVTAHRLVMRVIREQAAASRSLAEAARRGIGGLSTMLPAAEDAWRHPVLMQEFVTQVTALAGHLDAFPGLLDGQTEQDMLRLMNAAGWYLNEISDISRAIPLQERTLTDRERILGPDHPSTLNSRNNLAAAYWSAGRLDDAIALHERTVADRERVLGSDHPDTLISRDNLAAAYESAGRLDEAIALHERTLTARERVLGPDHPNTLRSRNNLGYAYRSARRLDEAIALHERTLTDRERVLGPDHPDTLTSRINLAAAFGSAGRLDDAIALNERTFTDCERVLGPDHPNSLVSRTHLASAYLWAGRLGEAIALFERNRTDCERVLGPDHPESLRTRNNLAYAYKSAGHLKDAIALYESTLTDCERALGGTHPLTRTVQGNLRIARDQG